MTPTPARDPWMPVLTYALMLWHLALAADYMNARLALNAEAPQLTAALALPQVWAVVGWGLAVWLGLLASVFLMLRDDAAVLLFFAAAAGAAAAGAGDIAADGTGVLIGLPRPAVLAAMVLVPALGWIYTRARHASGHLT